MAASLAEAQEIRSVAVFVYHRFDPAAAKPMTVTTPVLRSQLAWLEQHHYRVMPLRAVLAELSGAAPFESGAQAAITVDDGHRSVYSELFPLIRTARIPVTLFIYPSAISNASWALTWDQLREMQASGLVAVESHTYWHPNFHTERRRRNQSDYDAFVDSQLRRSKEVLEARLGAPVDAIAWPFGIVDSELETAARRDGYSAAFAYVGGPARPGDDLLALPRIPVTDADRGDRFGALLSLVKHEKARQ
jgi:peptidoglycan/xylan/chitin deacetylase (PgdA/CDA1 family)